MVQSISLEVRETPTSFSGGDRERKWREAIEKEAQLKKRNEGVSWSLSISTVFTVAIRFELVNERGSDLDNLIKPVIDTLFDSSPNRPSDRPMPTGALFKNISDKQVFEIHTTKIHAEIDKAVITVSWN